MANPTLAPSSGRRSPDGAASPIVAGDGRVCAVCGAFCRVFAPGPGGHRPDASCPSCHSLERHRFLALAATGLVAATRGNGLLLDVAPMRATADLLRGVSAGGYLSIDFDPGADNRLVDVQASLTHLPIPDASVALAVCMHVLEHVPDDASAMRELARTLAPGGIALVQVPWRSGPTDEDPSAGPEERVRRFGQVDHVRYYGDDFEDRLRAAGLTVSRFTPGDVVPTRFTPLLGLVPTEPFWLCATGHAHGDPLDALRGAMPEALAAVLARSATAQLAFVELVAAQRAAVSGAAAPRRGRASAIRSSAVYRSLRKTAPASAAARMVRRARG